MLINAGEKEEKPVCLSRSLLQGLITHSQKKRSESTLNLHSFNEHASSLCSKGKLVGGAEARARRQPWQTKGNLNQN